MNVTLKNWLLPLGIVLFLIAGILVFRGYFSGAQNEALSPEESLENPLASIPAELLTSDQKKQVDQVAMATAMRSGNLEECELIRFNLDLKKSCEDSIHLANTLKTQTPDCKLIQEPALRQDCENQANYKMGIAKGNVDLCNKIQDEILKQSCLDEVHLRLARLTQSTEECSKIKDSTFKSTCESELLLTQATTSQSPELCAKLSTLEAQDHCKESIQDTQAITQASNESNSEAFSSSQQFEACKKLSGTFKVQCEDSAYQSLALERNNPDFCDELSTGTKQLQCMNQIQWQLDQATYRRAFSENNKSLCQKISTVDLKITCQQHFE